MDIRDWAMEIDEDSGIMFYEDLDDACIGVIEVFVPSESGGVSTELVSVYDWELLVQTLMKQGIETVDDADEYISFNIANAYYGPQTPRILNKPEWITITSAPSD